MPETPSSLSISMKLERIAKLARDNEGKGLTTLAHFIDLEWLREAFRRTRKDGAPGVDQQTADEYAGELESNLQSLLNRAKSGVYRAPPVRRVHIPKGDGKQTRPIGIPTFEDKVLQRAVAMLLSAVYEQVFLDCSYGFRPRRSAHQALRKLRDEIQEAGGGWVLEIDIRKFFDSLDHERLREVLRERIRDGVVLRLVSKWLHAGVFEDGELSFPEAGTPQGGVVSPILANVFLHAVLDSWFEREVKPRLFGRAALVRYADDAVFVFANKWDAERVFEVLPKRFGKFGLALHPEKTRLLDFRRPAFDRAKASASVGKSRWTRGEKPRTFDFLGFTHYWRPSRRRVWSVFRKTAKNRLARAVKAITAACYRYQHDPVRTQVRTLSLKLNGHYGYFGITGNFAALEQLYKATVRTWKRSLSRRSQKARITWDRMALILERHPLPKPRVVHSVFAGEPAS